MAELEQLKQREQRELNMIVDILAGKHGTTYIVGTSRGAEYWMRQKQLDPKKVVFVSSTDIYQVHGVIRGRKIRPQDKVCWTGEEIHHNSWDLIRQELRIAGWRGNWDEIYDQRP